MLFNQNYLTFVGRELALIEASEALLFKRNKEGAVPEVRYPYVFDNYEKAKQTLGTFLLHKWVLGSAFKLLSLFSFILSTIFF